MAFYEPNELAKIVTKKPELAPYEEPPISEYEIGSLGRYERVRLDIPVSEPGLYNTTADWLERLAMDFRVAARTRLPDARAIEFKHERLMLILAMQRRVNSVRQGLAALWREKVRKRPNCG